MKKKIELRKKQIECDVLENVIFTKISIQFLHKTPILYLAPLVEIIAHQNNLPIYYSSIGFSFHNKIWKKSMNFIEKSILNN